MRLSKKLIEQAYTSGAQLGLSVWCEDEAGPFQAVPHPGPSWQPQGSPARQPHEYIRAGTTKILTLFHPASGQVRLHAAQRCTNAVLHPSAAPSAQAKGASRMPDLMADDPLAGGMYKQVKRVDMTEPPHLADLYFNEIGFRGSQ
jgi:hypothetical protein